MPPLLPVCRFVKALQKAGKENHVPMNGHRFGHQPDQDENAGLIVTNFENGFKSRVHLVVSYQNTNQLYKHSIVSSTTTRYGDKQINANLNLANSGSE